MVKRWGYIVLVALLIGFVLFVYNGFNGNPISKYVAKNQLETYLEKTYPKKGFIIRNNVYDFKYGGYVLQGGLKGEERTFEFVVRPFVDREIVDMYKEELVDTELSKRISEEASNEVTTYIQKQQPEVEQVYVNLNVNKGEKVSFSKELMKRVKPHLEIKINATHLNEKQFIEVTNATKQLLEAGGYMYSYANVNGNTLNYEDMKDGVVLYGANFTPRTKSNDIKLTYSEEIKEKERIKWTIQKGVVTALLGSVGIGSVYFLVRGFRRKKG